MPSKKAESSFAGASASGAMEAHGAYNRYGRIPAGGAGVAVRFLERAANEAAIEAGDEPLVIADYGSSQGKNSLDPMKRAIRTLRARVGPARPVMVYHTDLPSNDFNTLFQVLDDDPGRYTLGDPNVFSAAIAKSFYGPLLPPASVHVGWCSYAAVWLSRIPALIPGHFVALAAAGEIGAQFDRQGARDWETFLSLRAAELRSGGRLVVVLPGRNDEGISGFEDLFDHANEVLTEMARDRVITAGERTRMVLGVYARRNCDLLAPFASTGEFHRLVVKECDLSVLPDPMWTEFENSGKGEVLAAARALFFRATFVPSLALCLAPDRDHAFRNHFARVLEHGLEHRLAKSAAPLQSYVQTFVVAKTGSDDAAGHVG